nr:CPBP family intramembrane glutamic endopeptidase [Halovenus rubra]
MTVLTLGVVLAFARRSADSIDQFAPTDAPTTESTAIPPDDSSALFPRNATTNRPESPEPVLRNPDATTDSESKREPDIVLTPVAMMANVAFTQGVILFGLVLSAWYFDIPADAFGSGIGTGGGAAVVVGVGFGIVLWGANELSTTVADAVGAAYDERVRELLAPESIGGWIALFGVVLPIIAVSEELLFRGALIGVPEMGFGLNVWVLAFLSSLAFALGHGAQGRVGVVVTGALGLVLAGGYVVTGSLLIVIVAHYVINALEFAVHELPAISI